MIREEMRNIMDVKELAGIVRENGIVGAGGAGFPTYVKIDERVHTILLNCAECEPLLRLHRQLLKDAAEEILTALACVKGTLHAERAVIGIKREYEETVSTLQRYLQHTGPAGTDGSSDFSGISIHLLDGAYPMGDEVVLIYETTGKTVRPGGLPVEQGVAVFNVETMYNIYQALYRNMPVTDKLVSIVGEVARPVTLRVPLGVTLEECVCMAGGTRAREPVYLVGGPMMGNIRDGSAVVTKTTNALILLEETHPLIQKKRQNVATGLKRAASACCQCRTCTDLCPRHALGHPIEPHRFMRAAANRDFRDHTPFLNTMFCSSCGLCEMYSCPQGLAPRSLIAEYRAGLRRAGIRPPQVQAAPVSESRAYRKAPEKRLEARLGLSAYDVPAPFTAETPMQEIKQVRLLLSQHTGAPARPVVSVGDRVKKGQMVAAPAEGLSVPVHASIEGRVVSVGSDAVVLEAEGT